MPVMSLVPLTWLGDQAFEAIGACIVASSVSLPRRMSLIMINADLNTVSATSSSEAADRDSLSESSCMHV